MDIHSLSSSSFRFNASNLRLIDDSGERFERLQGGVDRIGHVRRGEIERVAHARQVRDDAFLQH